MARNIMARSKGKSKTRNYLGTTFTTQLMQAVEDQLNGEEILNEERTPIRELTVEHLIRRHKNNFFHNSIEKERKILDAVIKDWMGKEHTRILEGWTVQQVIQERQQFDRSALLFDDPDLYAAYSYVNEVKILYVTPSEDYIWMPK
jgi:hypothetical protein